MFVYGIKINGASLAVALALILAAAPLHSALADLVVVPSEPSVPDLAGDWRLALLDDDRVSREINLTLYQAQKEVFGWGNMTTGNVSHAVVAGGSLEEDNLDLYMISEAGDFMLKLLFKVCDDDSISGDYEVYSSDGVVISGRGSVSWHPSSGISISFGSGFGVKPKPTLISNNSSSINTGSEGTGSNNFDSNGASNEEL